MSARLHSAALLIANDTKKDEEGLENTACCTHGKSYRLAVAVF